MDKSTKSGTSFSTKSSAHSIIRQSETVVCKWERPIFSINGNINCLANQIPRNLLQSIYVPNDTVTLCICLIPQLLSIGLKPQLLSIGLIPQLLSICFIAQLHKAYTLSHRTLIISFITHITSYIYPIGVTSQQRCQIMCVYPMSQDSISVCLQHITYRSAQIAVCM